MVTEPLALPVQCYHLRLFIARSCTMQPRRSVLYMPGSNARALEKARSLPADSLILDLEDAVAPEQKTAARSQVLAALATGGYGHRECVVRINSLDSEWGQADLEQLAGSPARALCLPKVETPEQIRQAAEADRKSVV